MRLLRPEQLVKPLINQPGERHQLIDLIREVVALDKKTQNERYSSSRKELEQRGLTPDLTIKSFHFQNNHLKITPTSSLISRAVLMEKDLSDSPDKSIDFHQIILKNMFSPSDDEANKFNLNHITPKDNCYIGYTSTVHSVDKEKNTSRFFTLFLDGPFGLCVNYNGEPVFGVSFYPVSEKRLRILNYQCFKGTKNPSHSLKPQKETCKDKIFPIATKLIKYRETSIDLAEAVAKRFGFTEVEITSAENQDWVNSTFAKLAGFTKLKAKSIYDDVAIAKGYRLDSRTDDFIKILQT